MAALWRPVEFEESDDDAEIQEPPKKKQRRYHITEFEVCLVLEAYHKCSDLGWDRILEYIKQKLGTPLMEHTARTKQTVEYYLEYCTTQSAIKRMQRIVAQNVQKLDQVTPRSSQSSRMSLVIKENKTRYSQKCTPDKRKLTKFNQAINLSESSSSDSTQENYDRCPESDNSANGNSDALLSDKPSTSKTSARERERKPPNLKRQKKVNAGKLRNEANQKHVEMCNNAIAVMGKLNKLLDKYEESDDTD